MTNNQKPLPVCSQCNERMDKCWCPRFATSKEKVLTVYPEAASSDNRNNWWYIYNGEVGANCLSIDCATEADAWDDAASKLPSAPSPAGETASEPMRLVPCLCCGHDTEAISPGCKGKYCDYCFLKKLQNSNHQCELHAVPEPVSTERSRSKQVPEQTISDECRWCAEGMPEWSPDAQCWIHRRPSVDKRCLRKTVDPDGEFIRRVEAGDDVPSPWRPSAEGDGWIANMPSSQLPNKEKVVATLGNTEYACERIKYGLQFLTDDQTRTLFRAVLQVFHQLPAPPSGQGEKE